MLVRGVSSVAVAGVAAPMVDGESASSTACDNEDSATIGGSTGGGLSGMGDIAGRPAGVDRGGDLALVLYFEFGELPWGLPNPVNEPKEPDSRFEKLLLLLFVAEVLLDAVDCDQRFKLPTPSLSPCLLSGLAYRALERLFAPGDVLL